MKAVFNAIVATVLVVGSVVAAADAQGTDQTQGPVAPGGAATIATAADCVVCYANAPWVVGTIGVVAGGIGLTLSGNSGGVIHSSSTTPSTTTTTTTASTTTTKTPTTTTTTTTKAK